MIPTVQPSVVMPLNREGVIQYICRDDNPRQPLFTRDDVQRYVHNDEGHRAFVIVEAMDRRDPHSLHVALATLPPLRDALSVETNGPAVVVQLRRDTGAINSVVVTGRHQLVGPGSSYRRDPKLVFVTSHVLTRCRESVERQFEVLHSRGEPYPMFAAYVDHGDQQRGRKVFTTPSSA